MDNLFKKTIIGLAIGLVAVVLITAGLLIYNSYHNSDADSSRLEFYDPDNPEMAADSMSVLYNEIELTKDKIAECKSESKSITEFLKKFHFRKFDPKEIATPQGYLTDVGLSILQKVSVSAVLPSVVDKETDQTYSQGKRTYSSILLDYLILSNVPSRQNYLIIDGSNRSVVPDSSKLRPVKNVDSIASLPAVAAGFLTNFKKTLEPQAKSLDSTSAETKNKFSALKNRYLKSKIDIHKSAIYWGIPTFAGTAILLYCVGVYYRERRIKNRLDKDCTLDADFLKSIKDSTWISVYLITVLLLIITIFILGLAGLLTENTLAALLGGIAGYVLNNKDQITAAIAGTTPVVKTEPASIPPPSIPPPAPKPINPTSAPVSVSELLNPKN